ncbi:MAG: 4-hydroxy-tetrahydrodipicolinate reductase [Pseudomonadota bacterium]
MKSVRIIVLGALGRMGRAVLDAISNDASFHLKGAVIREGRTGRTQNLGSVPISTNLAEIRHAGAVVIDVTQAEAVSRNIAWAARAGIPYVLAVTGMDRKTEEAVRKAARKIPVVVASNLSVGIAVLHETVKVVAALLPEADIEIVETHHRGKKDAPSGTALALAGSILQASPRKKRKVVLGHSQRGKMESGNIYIQSLRGGDVVGEHEVVFFADGERVKLGHVATSRAIFARGALCAARFIAGKKPGLYSMQDVLGLGKS